MADYTPAEIQAAVERIVRSAIRRSYGTLGNRQLGITLNDYQESAAGVLVLYSNSPFYVVKLGTQRLGEAVASLRETVASLVEAIENANRHVRPVEDLSSLENAKVALQALEEATASRTLGFADIGEVPAFKRFDSNTQRFLDSSSSNIRRNGEVVPTPQESRAAIPGLVSTLKENHAEVVRRTSALAISLSDFETLNLPSLLSQSVLSQARAIIEGRVTELEGLTPQGRLGSMRDVTLDVLAARAVVANFTSLRAPGTFVLLEGEGSPFADASHPATPATLLSDIPDPWAFRSDAVEESNELDFTLDGSFSFLLALPGAFPARLDAIVSTRRNPDEGVDIAAGVSDALDIDVSPGGFVTVNVSFTADANKLLQDTSGASIIDEINAAVPGLNPVEAEAVLVPVRVQTAAISTTSTGPDTADLVRSPGTGDWTSLGVVVNDEVEFLSGTNAGLVGYVSAINAADDIEVTTFDASAITTASDDEVRIGTRDRYLRLRIKDAFIGAALSSRYSISVPADPGSVENTTLNTLGLIASSTATSRLVRAEDLKEALDSGTASASSEVSRLSVEPEFVASILETVTGRTEVTNQARAVLYTFRGRVDIDAGATSTVTTDESFFGVEVGDQVVIRATTLQAQQLLTGIVDAVVSNTEISVNWTGAAALLDTNVLLEVSPAALSGLALDSVLVISDGLNQGSYRVVGQEVEGLFAATIIGELTLERPMPVVIAGSGQPQLFNAQLGRQHLRFSSVDTTTSSAILIHENSNPESGYNKIFNGTEVESAGTTLYLQLPELPSELEVGDVIEVHDTDPVTPTFTRTVVDIETLDTLVELDEGIAVNLGPFNFSNNSPVPFARIRKTQRNTFDAFESSTTTWLERDVNDPLYFTNLDRYVNSLTRTTNPTLAEVNTARSHVQNMDVALSDLEDILTAYSAQGVPQIDTLIESFLEKGADRAVDILLEGRYSDFFGLDQDSVSYAGAVLSSIRAINQEDLPVRRMGRENNPNENVVGEMFDVDYEFDQSDINDFDEAIIPGEFFMPKRGDAF